MRIIVRKLLMITADPEKQRTACLRRSFRMLYNTGCCYGQTAHPAAEKGLKCRKASGTRRIDQLTQDTAAEVL